MRQSKGEHKLLRKGSVRNALLKEWRVAAKGRESLRPASPPQKQQSKHPMERKGHPDSQ